MTACLIHSFLNTAIFWTLISQQGSVVTQLRCGGTVNEDCVANLLVNLSVKEFWKLVNIWRSYGQDYGGLLFIDWQCISIRTFTCPIRCPKWTNDLSRGWRDPHRVWYGRPNLVTDWPYYYRFPDFPRIMEWLGSKCRLWVHNWGFSPSNFFRRGTP